MPPDPSGHTRQLKDESSNLLCYKLRFVEEFIIGYQPCKGDIMVTTQNTHIRTSPVGATIWNPTIWQIIDFRRIDSAAPTGLNYYFTSFFYHNVAPNRA